MLKCIKASIIPVNCKLKNPLKCRKSYNIIQRAGKQLLYERIRNINSTLEAFEEQRKRQYLQFKDMLNMLNQHDQEADLERCRLFINKIKEHGDNKTKKRQIDKFDRLFYKRYGYHHNLTRQMQTQNFSNIDQQCTLSGHHNVPSSFCSTSTQASSNPAVPATSMAPTPSTGADLSMAPSVAPGHPPSNSRPSSLPYPTCLNTAFNRSPLPLPIQVGAYTFLGKYPMLRSNTTPNTPKVPTNYTPYSSAILVSFSV